MTDSSSSQARLLALLAERSWRRGPVTLASGKVSDFYIDCKQTVLHAEGAALVGERVHAHVQAMRQAGTRVDGVGGLTLGADPIAVATATISALRGAPVHAFIIRKEPKGHGTAAWLEGGRNLPAGASVLIVEDVITTGGSTRKAVQRAIDSGLRPVGILTLVDRQEGGREALHDLGLPIEALTCRADFDALAAHPTDAAS